MASHRTFQLSQEESVETPLWVDQRYYFLLLILALNQANHFATGMRRVAEAFSECEVKSVITQNLASRIPATESSFSAKAFVSSPLKPHSHSVLHVHNEQCFYRPKNQSRFQVQSALTHSNPPVFRIRSQDNRSRGRRRYSEELPDSNDIKITELLPNLMLLEFMQVQSYLEEST